MKKLLLGGALLVVILLVIFSFTGKKDDSKNENVVYKNTIDISREYFYLRLKTDHVLKDASSYANYDSWNKEMTKLIDDWGRLETKAKSLEKQADFGDKKKVSLRFINIAKAYTKDEISNVFDKAPAGKKIKTLAKFLGVDAKRAYKILKNDQEFVKADAWNDAGDTFKKLEVSAVVIKDGCKVAGFIGAAAITGGATAGATIGSAGVGAGLLGGTATVAEATVMIVTGTDLMLEVSEDGATIGLGDNHKATKFISGLRSYTDPAASILSLTDIPSNIGKGAKLLDKVGVFLTEVDQIRSMVQDGKLLGINITPDSKIEVSSLEKDEVEKWLDENEVKIMDDEDFDDWMDGFDDLGDLMDGAEIENEKVGDEVDVEDGEEEVVDTNEKENTEDSVGKKVYSKDGKVSAWIASPHGALSSGQTQMWEVKVDGYDYYGTNENYTGENRGYQCYWDYLTEYKPGVKPWMNLGGCKRVSGVPGKDILVGEPSGELKVKVRIEFMVQDYGTDEWGYKVQKGKKVEETIELEESYEITPYFHSS